MKENATTSPTTTKKMKRVSCKFFHFRSLCMNGVCYVAVCMRGNSGDDGYFSILFPQ